MEGWKRQRGEGDGSEQLARGLQGSLRQRGGWQRTRRGSRVEEGGVAPREAWWRAVVGTVRVMWSHRTREPDSRREESTIVRSGSQNPVRSRSPERRTKDMNPTQGSLHRSQSEHRRGHVPISPVERSVEGRTRDGSSQGVTGVKRDELLGERGREALSRASARGDGPVHSQN